MNKYLERVKYDPQIPGYIIRIPVRGRNAYLIISEKELLDWYTFKKQNSSYQVIDYITAKQLDDLFDAKLKGKTEAEKWKNLYNVMAQMYCEIKEKYEGSCINGKI